MLVVIRNVSYTLSLLSNTLVFEITSKILAYILIMLQDFACTVLQCVLEPNLSPVTPPMLLQLLSTHLFSEAAASPLEEKATQSTSTADTPAWPVTKLLIPIIPTA